MTVIPSGRIDLHTHTTASDGTLSPAELVEAALQRGISVLGITDHDSVESVDRARALARGRGLTIVAGLELSTKLDGLGVHLLAYGIDDRSTALRLTLADRVAQRAARARGIVQRLAEQGVSIPWDLIQNQTSGAIGRPHIARALMELGYAGSVSDAFARWIGQSRSAYLPSPLLSPADAVQLATAAGGQVALAHPLRGRTKPPVASSVPALIAAGVTGLEVYYSGHEPADVIMLRNTAAENGLWCCGGSDFHGANKPRINLGSVDVPSAVLQQGPFARIVLDRM